MLFDDIPRAARPLEVAILMLYDPLRDNKKEVRFMLHLKSIRSVQKVVVKYKTQIDLASVRKDSLLRYIPGRLPMIHGSSFSPPPR